MAGRNPAWGLTGGVGEVGEKLHGVERNPWIASVGAGTAGGGGATEQQLRRRGHAAPAALRRGRSGRRGPVGGGEPIHRAPVGGGWREEGAPRRARAAGSNGGAATPFWPRDCSSRLDEGRRVEREGGTPLGEANGEGESSARGERSNGATRRVRRRGGVLAERE